MNQQMLTESQDIQAEEPTFWGNATKYVQVSNGDEPFVDEVAYIMVTLHRTGA